MMLPAVFVEEKYRWPLFIFQGRRFPYRTIKIKFIPSKLSLADFLPSNTYITTMEDVAGVEILVLEDGLKLLGKNENH